MCFFKNVVVILVHFFTKHTFVEGYSSMLSQGVKCVVNIIFPLVVNVTASGGGRWRMCLTMTRTFPLFIGVRIFALKGTTCHMHL